jgi:hypothetical protein
MVAAVKASVDARRALADVLLALGHASERSGRLAS